MSNGVEQPANAITLPDVLVVVGGVALFAWWLLHTSLGRTSLAGSKPRRNALTPAAPFLIFLLWFAGVGGVQGIILSLVPAVRGWRALFLSQIIYAIGSATIVALILVLVQNSFARGLKGFGLRLRTAPKDLGYALLTLLTVWPLILATMSVTMLVTKLFRGPEYRIPQHEVLKLLTEYPTVPLEVILVVASVIVAPIVEEMVFRGLFQTMIRSYSGRPWLSIALTSLLFASVHGEPTHWPTLFVLSLGLGYAYEHSGSLLRPMFMHAVFNGISVVAVLTQAAGRV